MRLLFFGTYDAERHPRVKVMQEGFAARGDRVTECAFPLTLGTDERVAMLRQPWRAPRLAGMLATRWVRLWRASKRLPEADAVVVGYMGHFDIHLARARWKNSLLVLDHLISARGTAIDRRIAGAKLGLLDRIDRAALSASDLICVDTAEHLDALPADARRKAVVVPVGASSSWFEAPRPARREALSVVFFGTYTPLQGAPVIGEAISRLGGQRIRFTLIGSGQDLAATMASVGEGARVEWRSWVKPDQLPSVIAEHDVCLGIFGIGPKGSTVVPNKVFQGAAAGCAVITSDTPPQRRALGDAALYVPPGDAPALADMIRILAEDSALLERAQKAARSHADEHFRPAAIVEPLRERLASQVSA